MNSFKFLEKIDEELYGIAEEIEGIIYDSPDHSAAKMRIFIENMLDSIIRIENLDDPQLISMTLFNKIKLLGEKHIEDDILNKLHEIRMLGNRASHGESIETEEVLTKHKDIFELAVWFVESYIDIFFEAPKYEYPKKPKEKYNLDKKIKGSHLLYQLTRLSRSAPEAVIGPDEFNDFKKYLHVDTVVKEDLEAILKKIKREEKCKLVLLCGSVGDGKSHLISYLNNYKSSLLEDFYVHNDATVSFNPEETDIDTLSKILDPYKDKNIGDYNKSILLAINLGVLNKFLEDEKVREFKNLSDFIDSSKLFYEDESTINTDNDNFEILNLTDYFPFVLKEEGPESRLIVELLSKICDEDDENPFNMAYKEDETKKEFYSMINNFDVLKQKLFQERVINLIIKAIVEQKLILSIRDLLDLIYNFIIPADYDEENIINMDQEDSETIQKEIKRKLENYIVNLTFDYPNRSAFLNGMQKNDPFNFNCEKLDNKILALSNSKDIYNFFDNNINISLDKLGLEYLKYINSFKSLEKDLQTLLIKTFVRLLYFFNHSSKQFDDAQYERYMTSLYGFYSGKKRLIKNIQNKLLNAINLWNGEVPGSEDYKYIDSGYHRFKLAQKISLKSYTDHIIDHEEETIKKFKLYLKLGVMKDDNGYNKALLNVDYPLFALIEDINKGYIPNSSDKEESIKLVKFITDVKEFGHGGKEVLIFDKKKHEKYLFKYDEAFDNFVFKEC